tara:strand:+ start:1174 stop:1371 length:198 start_codon:yes stop_codon:yes gene_type:complete
MYSDIVYNEEYSDMTTEELLIWSRDCMEFLIKKGLINEEESSIIELVDKINKHFEGKESNKLVYR